MSSIFIIKQTNTCLQKVSTSNGSFQPQSTKYSKTKSLFWESVSDLFKLSVQNNHFFHRHMNGYVIARNAKISVVPRQASLSTVGFILSVSCDPPMPPHK